MYTTRSRNLVNIVKIKIFNNLMKKLNLYSARDGANCEAATDGNRRKSN
jgi:hypothetical protein